MKLFCFHVLFLIVSITVTEAVISFDLQKILPLLKLKRHEPNSVKAASKSYNPILANNDEQKMTFDIDKDLWIREESISNDYKKSDKIPKDLFIKNTKNNYVIKRKLPGQFSKDRGHALIARNKVKFLNSPKHYNFKDGSNIRNHLSDTNNERTDTGYHMDPVLNFWKNKNLRRDFDEIDDDESKQEPMSSTLEFGEWKKEWVNKWMFAKVMALNESWHQDKNQVKMFAVQPWDRQCGDPAQHDSPWGFCVLESECEGEYRIYRGDIICGRTSHVCCIIQAVDYETGLSSEVNFEENSLSTDTYELRGQEANKHKAKKKKKRNDLREIRKKKIKKRITQIGVEVNNILKRLNRNATRHKGRKTRMLKKFLKQLKRQYKNDRLSVMKIHNEQSIKIDIGLLTRLNEISALNSEFMKNETFRHIILKGTMTRSEARMLAETYPELRMFLPLRRNLENDRGPSLFGDKPQYFEYDIEYGLLYY